MVKILNYDPEGPLSGACRELRAFNWFHLPVYPVGATARSTGTVAYEEEMQSVCAWLNIGVGILTNSRCL